MRTMPRRPRFCTPLPPLCCSAVGAGAAQAALQHATDAITHLRLVVPSKCVQARLQEGSHRIRVPGLHEPKRHIFEGWHTGCDLHQGE